jgi:Flp pilus assembly protein TadD
MSAVHDAYDAALKARLAGRDADAAVRAWQDGVAAQDRLEYHEPPVFYQPMRESLGAALVRAGRYAEAERVFREELAQHPGSGRALFGLWRALEGRGEAREAARVRAMFNNAWAGSDVALSLEDQ